MRQSDRPLQQMQEAAVGKIVSGTAFGCPDAGINFNFGMGRKSAKEFIGNAVKTGFLRSGNLQADVIEKFYFGCHCRPRP